MKSFVMMLLITASCSSNTADANPCATRGATYVEHFTETDGDCGHMADTLVNVANDGTIYFPSNISCQSMQQDACTAQLTNCQFSNGGVSCTESLTSTFSDDGSSASGMLDLTCSNQAGQECSSLYSFVATRQ